MAVRTDRYRLVQWTGKNDAFREFELYDLREDPDENVNIAAQQPETVERLAKILKAGWRAALPE